MFSSTSPLLAPSLLDESPLSVPLLELSPPTETRAAPCSVAEVWRRGHGRPAARSRDASRPRPSPGLLFSVISSYRGSPSRPLFPVAKATPTPVTSRPTPPRTREPVTSRPTPPPACDRAADSPGKESHIRGRGSGSSQRDVLFPIQTKTIPKGKWPAVAARGDAGEVSPDKN